MSNVNVDEIKVGDLIGFNNYNKKIALGYVVEIITPVIGCTKFWCHFSCKKDPERIGFLYDHNIDYHWKVINFEEESKMDELKVYTGKETLQAFIDGKVLQGDYHQYKLDDLTILYNDGDKWRQSNLPLQTILNKELTEVATPQAGDWVRFKFKGGTHTAKIEKVDEEGYWGEWNQPTSDISTPIYPYEYVTFEILTPEQVSEHKREQAFVKVGRKLNEFRESDIVYVKSLGTMAVVVSHKNDQEVRLHKINKREGLKAKPHQLTPISFVEQQVDLS